MLVPPSSTPRFRPAKARELIAAVLSRRLAGTTYNPDKMSLVSREIADEIKQRLKGNHKHFTCMTTIRPQQATRRRQLGATVQEQAGCCAGCVADAGWSRYKYAVQVLIGEQRGEGCRWARGRAGMPARRCCVAHAACNRLVLTLVSVQSLGTAQGYPPTHPLFEHYPCSCMQHHAPVQQHPLELCGS